MILRVTLAGVFLWFGFLKLFNVSPVVDIIAASFPLIIKYPVLYILLALAEIVIGIGILLPYKRRIVYWAVVCHLLIATLGVLFSPQAFLKTFPFLSVTGEFVVKNFVLIAAALLLLAEEPPRLKI